MTELYTDGGVIQKNPSPYGGTWAWCLVEDNSIVHQDSGIIQPIDLGLEKISNNVSELYAAMRGLSFLPTEWNGTIHIDSEVTLWRITTSNSFNNVPIFIRDKVLELRAGKFWKVILLGGHPTKAELKQGYRKRNNLPVSKWNQWCDQECTRLAEQFLANQT